MHQQYYSESSVARPSSSANVGFMAANVCSIFSRSRHVDFTAYGSGIETALMQGWTVKGPKHSKFNHLQSSDTLADWRCIVFSILEPLAAYVLTPTWETRSSANCNFNSAPISTISLSTDPFISMTSAVCTLSSAVFTSCCLIAGYRAQIPRQSLSGHPS